MTDSIKEIGTLLSDIPANTARAELPGLLKPILERIALLNPAEVTAVIHHELKDYFNLKTTDCTAYERMVRSLQDVACAGSDDEDERTHTKSLVDNLVYWTRNADKQIKYLLYDDTRSPRLRIAEQVTQDGADYRPKAIMNFILPDEGITGRTYDNDFKRLLSDIEKFIYDHVELPEDKNYLPLALWVMHTWLIEKFDSTCLLYFFGTHETGKSRAGQVLNELAFRCERITSPTEAVMFRSAHYFNNALVLDEIKLLGPDGNKQVEQLLKNRYKRGMSVPRIDLNVKEAEDQVCYYNTFGPLCMCTTESVDAIIGSRTIKYVMTKNTRKEVERPIDAERAGTLRDRLLYFRLHFFMTPAPECETPKRRRLGEKTIALYKTLLMCDPDKEGINYKEFMAFLDALEGEQKSEEADTFDAEIFDEILGLLRDNGSDAFFVKDLCGKLNGKLPATEKFRHNAWTIGKHVARMGFKKGAHLRTGRTWHATDILITRLKEQYGTIDGGEAAPVAPSGPTQSGMPF